jgi:hypothetical protein
MCEGIPDVATLIGYCLSYAFGAGGGLLVKSNDLPVSIISSDYFFSSRLPHILFI